MATEIYVAKNRHGKLLPEIVPNDTKIVFHHQVVDDSKNHAFRFMKLNWSNQYVQDIFHRRSVEHLPPANITSLLPRGEQRESGGCPDYHKK